MRFALFLTVFMVSQLLTAVSIAKTDEKRKVAAAEGLKCVAATAAYAHYAVEKCRSDLAIAVYPSEANYVQVCCVRD